MLRRVIFFAYGLGTCCALAIVLFAGCGPLPATASIPPPVQEVPAEIKAVIADRASVEVKPDDPLYALPADKVVDDLTNLDGCWAGWTVLTSPADFLLIRQGQAIADMYDYVRFDAPTRQFVRQGYGRNLIGPFAVDTYTAERGTYTVTASNRVAFTTQAMTVANPMTGRVFTLPDELDAYLADVASSEGGIDAGDLESMRAGMLEEFTNPQPWENLVTIQGDRLKLTDVWYDEETGAEVVDTENARICVRFPCPE